MTIRLIEVKCALFLITMWLAIGMTNTVFPEDSPNSLTTDVFVVITASQTHARGNQSEFLILQSSNDGILWKATAVNPRDGGNAAGHVRLRPVSFSEVFAKITKAKTDGEPAPSVPVTRFYSLLIVDERGAKTCVALDARQQSTLRTLLQPVFDDVLKNGPYAKPHIMLDVLLTQGALRATTKPSPIK